MEPFSNSLGQTEWALIISLGMLVVFMAAFFLSSAQKHGKSQMIQSEAAVSESTVTDQNEFETVTRWASLRHAGSLSHSGTNGSRYLRQSNIPREIQSIMKEIDMEIEVTHIGTEPESHVQLEIRVNADGYFEVGKRKGPSPFEHTLPRVTHSQVALKIWQPFINLNKEQVYSQVRFGRIDDARDWRIVFEIQHITHNFSHLDYEIYWERVQEDPPARVDLMMDARSRKNAGPDIYFRSS